MAESPQTGRSNNERRRSEALLVTWERITALFPTEADCTNELFRRAYKAGMIECPRCGNKEVDRVYGERLVQCKRCGKQWSFTARTFFHRIRRARPWLGAILLLEAGVDVNSSQFQDLAGIAYSTSWATFQKIAAAISNVMGNLCHELPSSLFSELFGKRSRETPARRHPTAEQEEIEKLAAGDAASASRQSNPVPGTSDGTNHLARTDRPNWPSEPPAASTSTDCIPAVSGQGQPVYELLSAEPIHFDVLHARTGMSTSALSATLTLLEMDGAVVRLPGDWYVRVAVDQSSSLQPGKEPSSQRAEEGGKIAGILYDLGRTYGAISRKYLQPYVARCWCKEDRSRWSRGAVMEACLQFGPITHNAILAYVSPPMVKVFACT